MKIVYNNPVLELTVEEEGILNRASDILGFICSEIDDYADCKCKCPIYNYCPYHRDFTRQETGRLYHILDDIACGAKREAKQ